MILKMIMYVKELSNSKRKEEGGKGKTNEKHFPGFIEHRNFYRDPSLIKLLTFQSLHCAFYSFYSKSKTGYYKAS